MEGGHQPSTKIGGKLTATFLFGAHHLPKHLDGFEAHLPGKDAVGYELINSSERTHDTVVKKIAAGQQVWWGLKLLLSKGESERTALAFLAMGNNGAAFITLYLAGIVNFLEGRIMKPVEVASQAMWSNKVRADAVAALSYKDAAYFRTAEGLYFVARGFVNGDEFYAENAGGDKLAMSGYGSLVAIGNVLGGPANSDKRAGPSRRANLMGGQVMALWSDLQQGPARNRSLTAYLGKPSIHNLQIMTETEVAHIPPSRILSFHSLAEGLKNIANSSRR